MASGHILDASLEGFLTSAEMHSAYPSDSPLNPADCVGGYYVEQI